MPTATKTRKPAVPKIVWENPPVRGERGATARSSKYATFTDALKAKPYTWARFPGTPNPAQTTWIKNAISSVFAPAGSFEAVSRTVEGERRIYVRYVGKPAAKAAAKR